MSEIAIDYTGPVREVNFMLRRELILLWNEQILSEGKF